jgi:chromosome segregation ATPase
VLADVTTDREEETQELADKVDALTSKLDSLEAENNALKEQVEQPTATLNNMSKDTSINPEDASVFLRQKDQEIKRLEAALKKSEAEKTTAKRETDKKARRLLVQERDFKVTKVQLNKAEEVKARLSKEAEPLKATLETLQETISDLKEQNQKLESDLEVKEKHVQRLKRNTPPRPEMGVPDNDSVNGSVSSERSEEVEGLQRNLSDTSSSLENAKKIIASLENANGSLALDLRGKLKAKEEELTFVQTESADRKRHLDSLATELRDLQKKHGDVTRAEKQTRTQVFRQKALMGQLQKSVSGLQSASVVHEVSTATGQPDSANVDQIAEILSDTLVAIRSTLEMSEQYADEFDDQSVAFTDAYTDIDVNSEVGRHIDALIRNDREAAAKDLRHELDQKSSAVRRLEEALKKQNEEMKRLRVELQERNHGNGQNDKKLRAEIQSLREQCSTNMEVLAKKERELSVLRSSLTVDENVDGYISDDSSDDEDESASVMSPARLNGYGVAETEALATILSNGGGIDLQGRSREVETMKSELLKAHSEKERAAHDLQSERESLANAKMIISSLEQANKGMMEDLRSRLQDSNTAIASLLDKSMDHEKASNTLQEEVERLQKEKEDSEQKLQAQVMKLKDEAKVFSLRIAAKDRQLNEVKSSSEEKKEEDLDDSAKLSSS